MTAAALRTALCERLGLTKPVISSGMGTVAITGYYTRAFNNAFIERYDGPVLPSLLQAKLAADVYRAGDPEYFPMHGGQSVELIHDLPGAAEVVERICAEAEAVLARLV